VVLFTPEKIRVIYSAGIKYLALIRKSDRELQIIKIRAAILTLKPPRKKGLKEGRKARV
jgi:hypothetical protein